MASVNFPAMLEKHGDQIGLVLPKHLDLNRMKRTALTAYRMQPTLQKSDPSSVFACVVQAAQLGLEIGVNGEAYLVPFWSAKKKQYECQMIPGYRGFIKLARNSADIETVSARIVHEHDHFEVELGLEDRVVHRPHMGKDRGQPVAAYCIAKYRSGGNHVEVMLWDEIMEIKSRTKSRNTGGEIVGPWVTDEEEMGRKTVVRRASKYWPLSVQLATAIALDNAAAAGIPQELDAGRIIAGESFTVPQDEPLTEPSVAQPESRSGKEASTHHQDAPPPGDTPGALISERQIHMLRKRIEAAALSDAEVCKHMGIDNLESLPFASINDALKFIANPG